MMGRTLTWNHSPLGRAGLTQEAKKMAVIARMGQAMIMRIPCARIRPSLTVSAPTSPTNVMGFTREELMVGFGPGWWFGKPPMPPSEKEREPMYTCLHVCCILYCLHVYNCSKSLVVLLHWYKEKTFTAFASSNCSLLPSERWQHQSIFNC